MKNAWHGRRKVLAAAVLLIAAVLAGWWIAKQLWPDGASSVAGADRQQASGKESGAAGDAAPFGEDGYVRSATYFGDEWPINFWNSEMDHLERDLEQIRGDGFDSVILVIPWKEFQPGLDPVAYSDYAFGRLDRVMQAAEAAGLKVYARVSYLWDYVNDTEEDIVERMTSLFCNPVTRGAWLEYAGKLYGQMSPYANYAGGFLTWEDYMSPFLRFCDAAQPEDRADAAKRMGFQEYVRSQYSLEEYNKAFSVQYDSYDTIPVPQRTEPAMKAMYAFFDESLNQLLADGQKVFPNLSMEVRLDADPLYDANGNPGYYMHEATYACQQSNYTSVMYGIPMGFENRGERVKARDAMQKTEYMLKFLAARNGGKPVYIEQFLFYDNTPQFAHNARLEEDEVGTYLLTCPEVLRKYSAGYGVWTYRDYYDNMLYNNGFLLEGRGWETEGGASFGKAGDSAACRLSAPAVIRQQIPAVRDRYGGEELTVSFDVAECAEPGTIVVTVGTQHQAVTVEKAGAVRLAFPRTEAVCQLALEAVSGTMAVDNIRLYAYVQNGFLYDPDNQPLEQRDNIREMNRLLAGEPGA